jgi:leader peptidase (prepilin peptidase)/N-methyltransferase
MTFDLVLTIFGAAAAFGAFAFAGVMAARTYWDDIAPLPDAPPRSEPPTLAIVAVAVLLGVLCGLRGIPPTGLAVVALTVGLMSAIWCVDVRRGIVPDALTLIPLVVLVLANALMGRWFVTLAAIVPAVPFAIMAWRTKGQGLGWGDVKLAALGGALLGMQTAMLSFAIAALVAVAVAAIRRAGKQPIPFGPYLASAIALPLALYVRI